MRRRAACGAEADCAEFGGRLLLSIRSLPPRAQSGALMAGQARPQDARARGDEKHHPQASGGSLIVLPMGIEERRAGPLEPARSLLLFAATVRVGVAVVLFGFAVRSSPRALRPELASVDQVVARNTSNVSSTRRRVASSSGTSGSRTTSSIRPMACSTALIGIGFVA